MTKRYANNVLSHKDYSRMKSVKKGKKKKKKKK